MYTQHDSNPEMLCFCILTSICLEKSLGENTPKYEQLFHLC